MAPWNRRGRFAPGFAGKDWQALESVWGSGTIFFGLSKPQLKGNVSRGMLVLYP